MVFTNLLNLHYFNINHIISNVNKKLINFIDIIGILIKLYFTKHKMEIIGNHPLNN
jgi:hypothetical protein